MDKSSESVDENNNKKKDETINLREVLYDSIKSNNAVIPSLIILLMAYWLQDVVFFGNFTKFTSNIPKFIENISIKSVGNIIFPYVLAESFFYINNVIVSSTIPKIELDVVEKLIEKTLLSLERTKKTINTNEYIMNLKKVIESKSVYYLFVSNFVPAFLVSVGLIYYFSLENPKYGLIVFLFLMIFAYCIYYILSNSVDVASDNEKYVNKYYDNIQDVVTNSDLVISSNTTKEEIKNLAKYKNDLYGTYSYSETITSENNFGLRLINVITVMLIDSFAIYLYLHNQMRIENVTSVCLTSIIFMKYFNTFVSRFRNTVGYIGKFSDIEKYFKKFVMEETSGKNDLVVNNGDILFSKIGFEYNKKKILSDFNYKIKGKTKICIVGEIGSGKTTLLKMLCGLSNYNGDIFIDGQKLKNCSHSSISKSISYVPQHPKIFNNTILYNIRYGTNKTTADVENFINKMNLEIFFKSFPQGINTQVEKEGKILSGGQKQLIAIIRAILQDKPIILFDEPTSSLDKNTKKIFIDLLKKIESKTIIVITHDQSILNIFDDFILMK